MGITEAQAVEASILALAPDMQTSIYPDSFLPGWTLEVIDPIEPHVVRRFTVWHQAEDWVRAYLMPSTPE